MNHLLQTLGITRPFIQGGMGNVSHVSLAVAVSKAGGLGTIGVGTMEIEKMEQMIKEMHEKTPHPFAVNVPINVRPDLEAVISLIKDLHVPVVSLSAGNPAPFIPFFKDAGTKVICVVANVKQALKAEQHGADVIVAEGFEAAGLNSSEELTTFTLIPQIAKAVTVPLIAAGGVGNGAGLLAALSLGAQGVQMGTRLIATKEAQVHDSYKQALKEASANDTIIVGRSYGHRRRLLNTPYAQELLALELKGMSREDYFKKTDETHHIKGAIEGKLSEGHINAGQITALIDDIPTVQELFDEMIREARAQQEKLATLL
ncbi:nitronate monooxygenase family protein [Halalkalibacterium halodurans]|uniref:Probable nitronate monooxygenase n=1 Tax=Halalkalibacterium halodurans (strain ATCC BAA-125 / DSM 18197 / FERM 7344 / JCM 9153 / C-125) TaxID=272558 RepID=Q9KGA2_HALH5|nr:nitronate monooxygenase family protein [Halalkalibacterium halodurans]MED4081309.1 nitronate monooxygenase family protein [Halalkalibacterium halodurans]MED4084024.1 nitronate monooxygenase family protein [Halalkalibacterium halodurans]MED4105971.1 nitronate monooxygenase family protein [Halalkalibacterium halodurans]MED4107355.1 nitronate monooxygenase family protein [Halalkalibacterium halodurans]MED4148812.1 nitronate monooxygenase family protein [Halalkalibacterium halodurans]